jgi:hypothetical protein
VAATKKNKKKQQSAIVSIADERLGQQPANWSAAKGGQVLPHFKHIGSEASTPPCPINIAAVFLFLCGHSLVGRSSISRLVDRP